MSHATTFVPAYTFCADNVCPTCLIERLVRTGRAAPAARDMNEEDVLDQIAGAEGVDRDDERTFDSGDFPKVILDLDLVDGETCGICGEEL